VNSGGTLICFDGSCELAIKQFNLPIKNVLEGLRSSDFYCPGSIVSLELDNKNPIATTLPANIPAYFINSWHLQLLMPTCEWLLVTQRQSYFDRDGCW
jgi:hypothetical protein